MEEEEEVQIVLGDDVWDTASFEPPTEPLLPDDGALPMPSAAQGMVEPTMPSMAEMEQAAKDEPQ